MLGRVAGLGANKKGALATHLFQQIVNFEIHFKDGLLTTLVVQGDDKRSRCGRCNIEIDVWTSYGVVRTDVKREYI